MKSFNSCNPLFYMLAAAVIYSSCTKSSSTKSKKTTYTVSTLAGTASSGATNGTGSGASFSFPSSLAFSSTASLNIGDFGNSLVRTINVSNSAVATFAGNGASGLLNGPAASAEFNGTANIVFDASGNLFVADEENNVIREVSSSGNVITIAGSGAAGYQDGPTSSAEFDYSEGMVINASGNLFVADGHNNVIRKINLSNSTVSTYAGIAGAPGFTNGSIGSASFNDPYGLALDHSGNIYVADIKNNCIRKITVSTGTVSTYAGSGTQGFSNGPAEMATFYYPLACTFDQGDNMYIADTYNNAIREVKANGTVSSLAGNGTTGSADGPGASATFNFSIGIAIYGNGIYVADTHNNEIRKITISQ